MIPIPGGYILNTHFEGLSDTHMQLSHRGYVYVVVMDIMQMAIDMIQGVGVGEGAMSIEMAMSPCRI